MCVAACPSPQVGHSRHNTEKGGYVFTSVPFVCWPVGLFVRPFSSFYTKTTEWIFMKHGLRIGLSPNKTLLMLNAD